MFVVYETKIVNEKLTFEFIDWFEQFDDAKEVAESAANRVVIPFDDDDGDNPETFFNN